MKLALFFCETVKHLFKKIVTTPKKNHSALSHTRTNQMPNIAQNLFILKVVGVFKGMFVAFLFSEIFLNPLMLSTDSYLLFTKNILKFLKCK